MKQSNQVASTDFSQEQLTKPWIDHLSNNGDETERLVQPQNRNSSVNFNHFETREAMHRYNWLDSIERETKNSPIHFNYEKW